MFGFLSMLSINENFKFLRIFFLSIFNTGLLIPDSKLVQNGETCVLVEKVIFTCRKPPKLAIKRWFVVFYFNFNSPLSPFSRGG